MEKVEKWKVWQAIAKDRSDQICYRKLWAHTAKTQCQTVGRGRGAKHLLTLICLFRWHTNLPAPWQKAEVCWLLLAASWPFTADLPEALTQNISPSEYLTKQQQQQQQQQKWWWLEQPHNNERAQPGYADWTQASTASYCDSNWKNC